MLYYWDIWETGKRPIGTPRVPYHVAKSCEPDPAVSVWQNRGDNDYKNKPAAFCAWSHQSVRGVSGGFC